MYSEKPPSRPEFFEPKESRQANATCGANASLTLGCSALGNGCVSPLTPRQFSTESCKGHTMYPESKRHRIFYLHPLLLRSNEITHRRDVLGIARKCQAPELPATLDRCQHRVMVIGDSRGTGRVV